MAHGMEERPVEALQGGVRGLVGPAAELDRQLHLASLELAVVKQPRARQRCDHDGGGPSPCRAKGRCGARLVVVLDEAQQSALAGGVSGQVKPDRLGRLVQEAVVESLVVTVVEALLEQLPLQVPVGFGDEDEARPALADAADDLGPVFLTGRPSRAVSPGPAEDAVDEQHGHVAAHPVALVRDAQQRSGSRFPDPGVKGVELGHVLPGGVVGVPAACEDPSARLEKLQRRPDQVRRVARDQEVGVFLHPVVVPGHVVRHEIQDQAETAAAKFPACRGEAVGAPEALVHGVVPYAVRGALDVVVREIRQDPAALLEERRQAPGQPRPRGAPAPDAHEPDGIETEGSDGFPFLRGDGRQRDGPAVPAAQFGKPGPGVDLVDQGLFGQDGHCGRSLDMGIRFDVTPAGLGPAQAARRLSSSSASAREKRARRRSARRDPSSIPA